MSAFVSNPELKKRGEEVGRILYGEGLGEEMHEAYRRKSPDIMDMSVEWVQGGLIGRPGLDLKTRELILIPQCAVAGIGMGAVNDPVVAHAQGALRAGATKREIYEALLMSIWYLGAGPIHVALTALQDFFDEEFFATEFPENSDPK
nr:carboxymuconolactone decarboxylase family protein [Rhodococcus sp. (in: high G+C Gram-positive bacteria)]